MNRSLSRREVLAAGAAALVTVNTVPGLAQEPVEQGVTFHPVYALKKDARLKWVYQSYLLQPTDQDLENRPGSTIYTRKWAMGELVLTDGPGAGEASGTLVFGEDATLKVTVSGAPGRGMSPATFEAVGEGIEGRMAGARYLLRGFAIRGNDGKLGRVVGSVFVMAGTHDKPAFEPGGMPVGTAGTFVIMRSPA